MRFEKNIMKDLRALSKFDNYHGILAIFWDYFQILLLIVFSCYMQNILIYIFTIFFIGSRQRALATILHESAHRVLAKNRKLNDFLGKFASGCLIFQTFKKYRRSHVMLHHNFLGIKNQDPDYDFYRESKLFQPQTKKRFILKHLIFPLFFSKSLTFIKYLVKNRLGDFKDNELKSLILLWIVILLLCFYTNTLDILFFYWFIPLVTTFPIIGWFIEMAEHFPIIHNQKEMERSWNRFGNKLELFFTGIHAENYHLVHHLMPSIPFLESC
ncbi:fatty acid desaturase family protein [Helicobacter apodemus]|uniref:fatty acid desaturase family protein n=1 Tax=Helicobacter apodemus TaxID=135569 RepID=UPI00194EAAE8|nr:fatty acid desaturase family protein [Helicobacter apodemus]